MTRKPKVKAPPAAEEKPAPNDWAAEAEQKLLEEMLKAAAHEGWTWRAVRRAGAALGFSDGETELLVPRGPADLAALMARRHDARALAILADTDPAALKIRARIRAAVEARLDAAAADEPATRRWVGWLALPQNLALGGRLAWESADVLWRWAGDTATDENHYSKRAILGGILTGALAMRMRHNRADALAFVDRQIQHVMDFEKWKATTSFRPETWLSGMAQALGKMRYGKAGPAPDLTDVP